jgi:PAS domain S-box-containing protein
MLAYHLLPPGSRIGMVLYLAIGFAAVAALTVGTLLAPHPLRRAWAVITASQAVWACGDLVWYVLDLTGHGGGVSVPDVFYVAGYLLLALGLVLMLRCGTQNPDWGDLVDVTIIAFAAGLVLWPFVFEPTVELGWSLATVVAVVYGASDVVLLALMAALFFDSGRRTVSVSLIVTSVAVIFAGDVVYYVPGLADSTSVGTWSDAAWIAGYALIGAAGLHRSSQAGVTSSRAVADSPLRRLRFVGAAIVALPFAFIIDALLGDGFGGDDDLFVYAAANAVVAVLVVFRTGLLLKAVERARREATSAQSRFESVFQSAGLGMSITTGGVLAQTNRAFQELVGYSSEELFRMRPSTIVHPDDLDGVVEEVAVDGSTRVSFERRYVRRDGSIVQTQVTLASPPDEDFAIAVVEDITGREVLEEQLREAQKMEAVGRLAGGIAHDFNNVLTVVSGHAELLRDGADTQDQEDIKVILDAVQRASDLTRQLLAFSRQQQLEPVVFNPGEVVRETEVLLGRVIGKFVRLQCSIDDAAPLVCADPVQLNQVLLNLAVNARDAMPDGGTLTLHVGEWCAEHDLEDRPGVAPGRYCRISVADTGTGMDEATQARIFEPFFTTKETGLGTGLGLATTYGIVKQSGGHIFVDSRLGHGTTFEILLPAAPGVSAKLMPPRRDLALRH